MTDHAGTDDYVHLFDALVPVAALRLLWSLEDRGATFRVDPTEHAFWVDPLSVVTDEDRVAIRRYKNHLVHLLRHCDLTPTQPSPSPEPVLPGWRARI